MEIERKFVVERLPGDLKHYPHRRIEQAYLCTAPVVRVRQSGEEFRLTCKGDGLMVRQEYELPLTEEAYRHLRSKADGLAVTKERYCIPLGEYTVELDVFDAPFTPLILAEVEFPTEEEALAFRPPAWFGREVTFDPAYTNASLSKNGPPREKSEQ